MYPFGNREGAMTIAINADNDFAEWERQEREEKQEKQWRKKIDTAKMTDEQLKDEFTKRLKILKYNGFHELIALCLFLVCLYLALDYLVAPLMVNINPVICVIYIILLFIAFSVIYGYMDGLYNQGRRASAEIDVLQIALESRRLLIKNDFDMNKRYRFEYLLYFGWFSALVASFCFVAWLLCRTGSSEIFPGAVGVPIMLLSFIWFAFGLLIPSIVWDTKYHILERNSYQFIN